MRRINWKKPAAVAAALALSTALLAGCGSTAASSDSVAESTAVSESTAEEAEEEPALPAPQQVKEHAAAQGTQEHGYVFEHGGRQAESRRQHRRDQYDSFHSFGCIFRFRLRPGPYVRTAKPFVPGNRFNDSRISENPATAM